MSEKSEKQNQKKMPIGVWGKNVFVLIFTVLVASFAQYAILSDLENPVVDERVAAYLKNLENSAIPIDDGMVLGETSESAKGIASSENFSIHEIKFGGSSAIFGDGQEIKPLEIIDARSENFTEKNGEPKILIRWKTNKIANSELEYAPRNSNNWRKIKEDGYGVNHVATISRLEPAMSYSYRITAKDRWGERGETSTYSFYTGSKEVSVFELISGEFNGMFGWALK